MNRLYRPQGNGVRPTRFRVIKNSEVIKVGDWIVDEGTGAANVDAITEPILGLAVGIVTANKTSLESASVDTAAYDGTWVAATKSYTATSDNETDKKVMVAYIPVYEGDEFVAVIDAAKGTTTGSNLEGYYLPILTSDSSKLDESGASTTITNTQFKIKDPMTDGVTTEVIVVAHLRGDE
jgi:hypothetical protein